MLTLITALAAADGQAVRPLTFSLVPVSKSESRSSSQSMTLFDRAGTIGGIRATHTDKEIAR